jgi:hypothetical protein
MRSLVLCPGCRRHVTSEETSCPFCQAVFTPRDGAGRCLAPPEVRLGRAVLVAAGAALLGVACQSAVAVPAYGGPGITPHADGGQSDGANAARDAATDTEK